jgi:hypothetical protein
MKLADALSIINNPTQGYLVQFTREGGTKDTFPDVAAGEKPFDTIGEAQRRANEFFLASRGKFSNVVVIRREDLLPPSDEERLAEVMPAKDVPKFD